MTEFELEVVRHQIIERIVILQDLAATHIAIYLSVLSAYMIVAFVAGERLSRLQVTLATITFVAANLMEAALIRGAALGAINNVKQLQAISPAFSPTIAYEVWPFIGSGVFAFGLIGPLWFMLDVRRDMGSKA